MKRVFYQWNWLFWHTESGMAETEKEINNKTADELISYIGKEPSEGGMGQRFKTDGWPGFPLYS